MDVEMPVLNCTDFYRNLVNKPHEIFTTAYRDYAIEISHHKIPIRESFRKRLNFNKSL